MAGPNNAALAKRWFDEVWNIVSVAMSADGHIARPDASDGTGS